MSMVFFKREIKLDVTWSYVKKQTAKMNFLPSLFSSLNSKVKIFVFECMLTPSFWLISVVTALVFGLSRHKVAHAVGKGNDPDHALTKCRLERKRKVADKMRSLRAGEGMNAEPPEKQKSPPGRDE